MKNLFQLIVNQIKLETKIKKKFKRNKNRK